MPVRKGEATRKTMVAARQIVETIGAGLVWPPAHAHRAVADVDAVRPHVEEHEDLCRAGIHQFSLLEVEFEAARVQEPAPIPAAEAPEVEVHGHEIGRA